MGDNNEVKSTNVMVSRDDTASASRNQPSTLHPHTHTELTFSQDAASLRATPLFLGFRAALLFS